MRNYCPKFDSLKFIFGLSILRSQFVTLKSWCPRHSVVYPIYPSTHLLIYSFTLLPIYPFTHLVLCSACFFLSLKNIVSPLTSQETPKASQHDALQHQHHRPLLETGLAHGFFQDGKEGQAEEDEGAAGQIGERAIKGMGLV